MSPVVSRIAPTPSGLLHKGNACNFVLTWALVRKRNGRLRLRIDDLDAPRVRQEYLDDIFFTLDWLGIDWDEGPTSVEDHLNHHSQQAKIPVYQETIDQIWELGKAFACQCSRKQIKAISLDGQYPETCREIGLDKDTPNTALRICTPQPAQISWKDEMTGEYAISLYHQMRDFVIRRKDQLPAYQIASLVDDLDAGVNMIIRGQDLANSTAAQLFLASILNADTFLKIQWCHHPLLLDSSGQKLSKSKGASAIKILREQGKSPDDIFEQVGKWLGWEDIYQARDLLDRF